MLSWLLSETDLPNECNSAERYPRKATAGQGARFRRVFNRLNLDRLQHLKYYFMVAHPGCGEVEARELALEMKRLERAGEKPVEGVQIFTPTPMTRSTCMYHTGIDPITGEKVFVPRTFAEKKAQKRLLSAPE